MPDAADSWFDEAPRPTCAAHGRHAESLCSRCGCFECELCIAPAAGPFCHACAAVLTATSLPKLSQRAAWKLLFVPVIGVFCLFTLATRGALPHADQLGFLAIWLVPFACGVWLLARPVPIFAFVGSLVAITLVGASLLPPLVADFSGQRALDLGLFAAGPLVALRDAFVLDRAHRTQRLLTSLASE